MSFLPPSRTSCLGNSLAVALMLLGCGKVGMPLPPELTDGSEHYPITTSGKAFSQQTEMATGPYRLFVDLDQKEDTESRASATRTTKTRLLKIQLARTEAPDRFISTGACTDTFAWTKRNGTMFADNVVDEMKCTGKGESSNWSLYVHRGEDNGYVGVFMKDGESTPIRSVHEQALSMQGPLRGFSSLNDPAEVHCRKKGPWRRGSQLQVGSRRTRCRFGSWRPGSGPCVQPPQQSESCRNRSLNASSCRLHSQVLGLRGPLANLVQLCPGVQASPYILEERAAIYEIYFT